MAPSIRYLDVETTGLHADAEILEIAILDEHGVPLIDTLVRPARATHWPDAECIHGIAPADVAMAPTAAELAEQIAAVLQGCEVVIYNADFDVEFLPPAARTWCRVHCAMKAFTNALAADDAECEDYGGDPRFVSLDDAAAHVRCRIGERHRARADALRCRAVWRYLTEPSEQARVNGIRAAGEVRRQALQCLEMEAAQRAWTRDCEQRRQSNAWMRWLRFPLWLTPEGDGRSLLERYGASTYHDDVVRLFTGYSRSVHELRERYALPEYRHRASIPTALVSWARLRAPRWARPCITPQACFVPLSGETFCFLYRADALEEAYAQHPLRRPFSPPADHKLYTRTQLKAAGYTPPEIACLVPAAERQNRWDGTWHPVFCLRSHDVASRHRFNSDGCTHRKFALSYPQGNMCSGDP